MLGQVQVVQRRLHLVQIERPYVLGATVKQHLAHVPATLVRVVQVDRVGAPYNAAQSP